ncbi:unnamed protein product [Haemonchus placei]|uniref:GMC_oxred_C domain-containing protein n=1 Tax=Haemonchus placei TaxID=6290 RepID=A0A0N4WQE2_HAEPC|nr:unnamed protein product [Haemonchus placei]
MCHMTGLELLVYYRPMNFTDHCFKIPAKVNIGMAPCSNSMCVTVIEPRILAGQHIGNNIIRGCFASVFKYGTTPRAQSSILGHLRDVDKAVVDVRESIRRPYFFDAATAKVIRHVSEKSHVARLFDLTGCSR